MPMISFTEFEAQLRELLAAGEYLRIANLIEDEGERYPAQYIYLTYWQIGAAARDNNPELAVRYLDELIEEGVWISQFLLRTSPSLENLQDDLDFNERVEAMAVLQRREAAQLLPLLTLRQDAEQRDPAELYPLLLGLHQERATALESIKFWQPAAADGWLVGVPQSSQAMWSGAYVWEDLAQAQQELVHHMQALGAKYPVDPRKVILAGHGQGGQAAAWLACCGGMDVRGFIAIAPAGVQFAHPDRWLRMLQSARKTGLRGALIAGELDSALLPEIKRLTDIFNATEVPTRLEVLSGVGSSYQDDYQDALLRAIDFILT